MIKEAVAKRYAKSLVSIAREDGRLEQYGEELSSFGELLSSNKVLFDVMVNPIYHKDDKKALLAALNKKIRLSPIVTNLLKLLIDKNRMAMFHEIVVQYQRLKEDLLGIARARVISAIPLQDQTLERLRDILAVITGKKVEIETEQSSSLIGGIITRVGDTIYDGSIRTQLLSLKESLTKE